MRKLFVPLTAAFVISAALPAVAQPAQPPQASTEGSSLANAMCRDMNHAMVMTCTPETLAELGRAIDAELQGAPLDESRLVTVGARVLGVTADDINGRSARYQAGREASRFVITLCTSYIGASTLDPRFDPIKSAIRDMLLQSDSATSKAERQRIDDIVGMIHAAFGDGVWPRRAAGIYKALEDLPRPAVQEDGAQAQPMAAFNHPPVVKSV